MQEKSEMTIYEIAQKPRTCGYYKDRECLNRYLIIENCEIELYSYLLVRGWRRFGKYFFTPICSNCDECVSIRVDTAAFTPSRTQKRILKSQKIRLQITRPILSVRHLELHNKYHAYMQQKKDWEPHKITAAEYFETFVEGHCSFGWEIDYFIGDELVGVALMDIVNSGVSAVYCYYDPDFAEFSIGTYSILKQIEFAKNLNIRYFYPGQWIENHPSMGYKANFKPFERLLGEDAAKNPIWLDNDLFLLRQVFKTELNSKGEQNALD